MLRSLKTLIPLVMALVALEVHAQQFVDYTLIAAPGTATGEFQGSCRMSRSVQRGFFGDNDHAATSESFRVAAGLSSTTSIWDQFRTGPDHRSGFRFLRDS